MIMQGWGEKFLKKSSASMRTLPGSITFGQMAEALYRGEGRRRLLCVHRALFDLQIEKSTKHL